MIKEYLFTSERLGFRCWQMADVAVMAAINADPVVMEYFPAVKTYEETVAFIERMQQEYAEKGYCYFAVDRLEDGALIGFIGLSDQTFEASFTPCTDVGWRLGREYWSNGYATEGARQCLQYGFDELRIARIYAIAPQANARSEQVMQRVGMQKLMDFDHPLLLHDERLKTCVLYGLSKQERH